MLTKTFKFYFFRTHQLGLGLACLFNLFLVFVGGIGLAELRAESEYCPERNYNIELRGAFDSEQEQDFVYQVRRAGQYWNDWCKREVFNKSLEPVLKIIYIRTLNERDAELEKDLRLRSMVITFNIIQDLLLDEIVYLNNQIASGVHKPSFTTLRERLEAIRSRSYLLRDNLQELLKDHKLNSYTLGEYREKSKQGVINIFGPMDSKDLFNVIKHEMGHALGYSHSLDPKNVMFSPGLL